MAHDPVEPSVKAVMLQAHLAWATRNLTAQVWNRMVASLGGEARGCVDRAILATEWVPLRVLLEIDRAVAAAAGRPVEDTYRALGHHSAVSNLKGVYKNFVVDEPHRFFEQTALLHRRFQNFGESRYEKAGDRSGRLRLSGYKDPSPIFCASGLGYYQGALEMLKVPGPIACREVQCQCSGDPACVFELSW
jgi:uncharacterized protein (TIGR02265 family)